MWKNRLINPWALILFQGEDGGGSASADGASPGGGVGPAPAPDPAPDPAPGGGGKTTSEDGGGNQPPSLRAQMAQGLEGDAREGFSRWADSYTTDGEFAKAAAQMRSQFDQRVQIPDAKTAKPEDWDKFYQRVGKPRNAADYKFDWGKDDQGNEIKLSDDDAAFFEAYKEHAHTHHHTQAQFDQNIKFFNEFQGKQETAFQAKLDAAQDNVIKELKQDWGTDYDANIDAAIDGGLAFAPDEDEWRKFVNLPLAGGMRVGDHPMFLKTFAKIGRSIAEDQRHRNLRSSGEYDNIQSEINRIEQEALDKGALPSDPEYHKLLEPLYQKLYPKKHTGQSGTGFGV